MSLHALYEKIWISNTDVTGYVTNCRIERTKGEAVKSINISFAKSVQDILALQNGQSILITAGFTTNNDFIAFRGTVEQVFLEGGLIRVSGFDKIYEGVRAEVTYSFDKDVDPEGGKISEIFKTLINRYTNLTADSTSVTDSGTDIILTKFVCNHNDVFERCKALAAILEWQFFYDETTDLVYFQPEGTINNGVVLAVGSTTYPTNLITVPRWKYDLSETWNNITIIGAEQYYQITETFTATAGQTVFQLSKVPADVEIKVNGVLKTGGVANSSSTYDYAVDREPSQRNIIFITAMTGGETILANYSYPVPVPVQGENTTSKIKYGERIKTYFFPELKNVDDARKKLTQLLAGYSNPLVTTKVQVFDVALIHAGEMVRVIDNINNEDQTLVTNRVVLEYPNPYWEIDIGTELWKEEEWKARVLERVHKLEEDTSKNQDVLVHTIGGTGSFEFQTKDIQITEQQITGVTSFILGHPTSGVLDVDELGNGLTPSTTIYKAVYR